MARAGDRARDLGFRVWIRGGSDRLWRLATVREFRTYAEAQDYRNELNRRLPAPRRPSDAPIYAEVYVADTAPSPAAPESVEILRMTINGN